MQTQVPHQTPNTHLIIITCWDTKSVNELGQYEREARTMQRGLWNSRIDSRLKEG